MVLRRPGTIHRKITNNKAPTAMDNRKSKKFKLRMKTKVLKRGGKVKTVRIAPEDEGIIPKVMVKKLTQKNPLANIKLSNKKRNKILKRRRYDERDKAAPSDEATTSTSGQQMEVETAPKPKKKVNPKAKAMDVE